MIKETKQMMFTLVNYAFDYIASFIDFVILN